MYNVFILHLFEFLMCSDFIFRNQQTWTYMEEKVCGPEGANLVSINDPYEYAYIRTLLWKYAVTKDIWIGLQSKAVSK